MDNRHGDVPIFAGRGSETAPNSVFADESLMALNDVGPPHEFLTTVHRFESSYTHPTHGLTCLLARLLLAMAALSGPAHAQNSAPVITNERDFLVTEGTAAVVRLTATDADDDSLRWAFGNPAGPDADAFNLSDAGELTFLVAPDYEDANDANADRVYEVTVAVSDGTDTTTQDIKLTVTDLPPGLTGDANISHPEGNRGVRLATYEVRDDVAWSLGGDDSALFSIAGGSLRFIDPPDFENATDGNSDNVYNVVVRATDGTTTEMIDVVVTVTNVDEPGTVTLSPLRPKLGTPLVATVADPETVNGTPTWQWERAVGRNGWDTIDGADGASYTPSAADSDRYLRAKATYADGLGTSKTVTTMAPHVVIAHKLSRLETSGHDSLRPLFPSFNPDTLHYGIGCGHGSLTLTLSTEEASTRLAVNGIQRPNRNSEVTLTGLNGEDQRGDIRLTLSGSDGASTSYVLHCVNSDAPVITTTVRDGATENLILFSDAPYDSDDNAYLLIIDNNGVPRFRQKLQWDNVRHFRTHPDGLYPYSYARPCCAITNFRPGGWWHSEFTRLDSHFAIVDTVSQVAPLTHSTSHDFLNLEDGGYVLLSYEPAQRDFSAFKDDKDVPYSTIEGTEDSVIQAVGATGEESFRWNSWGHMALEDCTQHRFPSDYAHVNTVEIQDGDYIASFRGCSQVLRIDGQAGNVKWRLGRSNRSDADWIAGGGTPTTPILDDPYGEFCGQHSATLLANGNLILFDNGNHCVVDPETETSQRESRVFSRVVEYALDVDSEGNLTSAIFQRHHSLHGGFDRLGLSQGHVEPMANGHWLVSWGRGRFDDDPETPLPPDESVTQVDPLTGREVLSVVAKRTGSESVNRVRAYPLSPVALAAPDVSLTATVVEQSEFHTGSAGMPTIVVAFNRPVVDIETVSPSVTITGATAVVAVHEMSGAPANAYRFTLTPEGDGEIRFKLNAEQACSSNGICTPDGKQLETVPEAVVIPGPVVADFDAAAYSVSEGAFVDIVATLNKAHGRKSGLKIPLKLKSLGTASAADVLMPEHITFSATEQSKTIEVAAIADAVVEGTETAELEFGTLPDGVTAGQSTTVVTIADATDDTLAFAVGTTELGEGNSTELTITAADGITFATSQTIGLTIDGTIEDGGYTLTSGGRAHSAPYALKLPAGANAVSATLSIVDDTQREDAKTLLIEATRNSVSLGSHTITVPANDGPLPDVTVSASVTGVSEGVRIEFTLRRIGATTDALDIAVAVSETEAMLEASPPASATIPANQSTVVVSVPTNDDSVVEPDSAITLQVVASSSYDIGAPATATVVVVDDDVATLGIDAAPSEISEGEEAVVTVSIENGVTFARNQTVEVVASGTAEAADWVLRVDGNPLIAPFTLILRAGMTATSATIQAVDDDLREASETVILRAVHGSEDIGPATVALAASDAAQEVGVAAVTAEVSEGNPVQFRLSRINPTEPNTLPALTVPVDLTDAGGRLSELAPISVSFAPGEALKTLSLATADDLFIQTGVAQVEITVNPDESDNPDYVISGTGNAQVAVLDNDRPQWALTATPVEVQEGETVTVSLRITNGVTFASRQRIPIFSGDVTGTARADEDFVTGGAYTLDIRQNGFATTLTLRTLIDTVAEEPETIVIAGEYDGRAIVDPPVTVTIIGNDGWVDESLPPALEYAELDGAMLTMTFDQMLDTTSTPAESDFDVRVAGLEAAVESVRVIGRTVVLTLLSAPTHAEPVTVNYAPGTNPIRDTQAQLADAFVDATAVETLLSIEPSSATEGGLMSFRVHLSQSVGKEFTVDWRLQDLTTESGVDYPAGQGGTLIIPAWAASAEITVATTDDLRQESDERFVVVLSEPAGFPAWAGIGTRAATGTLVDDDGRGSGIGGGGGGGSANRPPVIERAIEDQTLTAGAAMELDIRLNFYDRDQRALEYTVESADPDIVTVEIDRNGVITFRGHRRGITRVTVTAADRRQETVSQSFEVRVSGPALVPLLPRAADPMREGFVRLVNHDTDDGEVSIVAIDDRGAQRGPVTLAINAGAVVQFNSSDLEDGNADKGLSGGVGLGEGNWRLVLDSDADFEVLAYVRTEDGFLTSMHDVAPVSEGVHRVVIFNPGSNPNQVSHLRLINPSDALAEVTVEGVDDAGISPGTAVTFEVPAGASTTLTASELESGIGLDGALGDGRGKWRLAITADRPIVAMSLLSSPTGHLTNLSTLASGELDEEAGYSVPLFPSASDMLGRQGFVRVVNRSGQAGTVTITAYDDSDLAYDVLALAIDGGEAVHFNSNDLELGNAPKGLSGSTGAGVGDWRLQLESDLDLAVYAYIRTDDGFLTAMHDVVPSVDGRHWVAIFNPGSNPNQVSRLRLVNLGGEDAEVTVRGADDRGAPGGEVMLTVPAGRSRTVSAAELESGGEGLIGGLGDGSGKWRLRIVSDRPIRVVSLLSSPTGHLTNLSTAPDRGPYQ